MQKKSIVVAIYATLVLIGGIIGFMVANSTISLVMGSLFAVLLFICSWMMGKGKFRAHYFAIGLIFCLLAFFAYRFLISYQIAPAGIMTLLSGGVLTYLVVRKDHRETINHLS